MTYRAIWNGQVIAESDRTVSLEGNQYFTPDSVHWHHLAPSSTWTTCLWKGQASYFTLSVDGQENRDAAWCYADPAPAARQIRGHVAFWHGVRVQRVRGGSDDASRGASLLGRIAARLRG